MEKRAYAIDVLRCLAIVGMVLSGQILWNPELPAWLYHAQIPPPAFVFDPGLPGITWVDLVFPFFLFSMGAAFPFAITRKLENGVSPPRISWDIIKRWLMLTLFAVALANTRGGIVSLLAVQGWAQALLLIGTWGLFFCMFVSLPGLSRRINNIVNLCGAAALAGLLLLYRYGFELPVSVANSDVIILILANMALFGSLIWWVTRGSTLARVGVIAVLVAIRITAGVEGSWNEAVWNWTPAGWLYRAEYLKYLCIVLPGTIAGDMLLRWMKSSLPDKRPAGHKNELLRTSLLAALFIVVMWSLYSRHLVPGLILITALSVALYILYRNPVTSLELLHRSLFMWGLFWLVLGLCCEQWEGGIKKDHATYSYFFVTSGLASFAVVVISSLINRFRVNMSFLIACGRNPMIAYTVTGYIIIPVLALLHLEGPMERLAWSAPWLGVARGVLLTALMMVLTWAFTKKRIYWKS